MAPQRPVTGGDSDWRPAAGIGVLRLRAALRARARDYFARTGALEVDTPILSRATAVEAHIEPLSTRVPAGQAGPMYLRPSPELAMKRLLAAGVGDCWQLGRVFRDGERGRLHQPEFDLLEWYRLGRDHYGLMDDVEGLLAAMLGESRAVPAAQRLSYAAAFERHLGLDPLVADDATVAAAARAHGFEPSGGERAQRDTLLDALLALAVAPRLALERPTFIYNWPASQAALARVHPGDPRVAARFELYWGALELANGFHELADPDEQRTRFRAANVSRAASGLDPLPLDERFLAALEAGLPECAGVAVGFDRLAMLAAGADSIDEVLAFPVERA